MTSLPQPWVGSHVYMHHQAPKEKDTPTYDSIPPLYKTLRFDALDVLFISPFQVETDGTFGIGSWVDPPDSTTTGTYRNRMEWVIANARDKNPSIKLFATQFFSNTADGRGFRGIVESEDSVKKYAQSVAAFFKEYNQKTLIAASGKTVSARLDGYDIDVETATLVEQLPKIVSAVRSELDKLEITPKFYMSITPYTTDYLDQSLAKSLDFLNMQCYTGGQDTNPKDYLTAIPGLDVGKLTYGIEVENTLNNRPGDDTLGKIWKHYMAGINGKHYGGVWTWSLNGGNDPHVFTQAMVVFLHNLIHPTHKLKPEPTWHTLGEAWPRSGKGDTEKDLFVGK